MKNLYKKLLAFLLLVGMTFGGVSIDAAPLTLDFTWRHSLLAFVIGSSVAAGGVTYKCHTLRKTERAKAAEELAAERERARTKVEEAERIIKRDQESERMEKRQKAFWAAVRQNRAEGFPFPAALVSARLIYPDIYDAFSKADVDAMEKDLEKFGAFFSPDAMPSKTRERPLALPSLLGGGS